MLTDETKSIMFLKIFLKDSYGRCEISDDTKRVRKI